MKTGVLCSANSRGGSRLGTALLVLVSALSACGGGGGGDAGASPVVSFSDPPTGPPAVIAAMGPSATDAVDSVKAVVAAADGLVARHGSMKALGAALGVSVAGGPAPVSLAPVLQRASRLPDGRAHILATTIEPCTEVVDAPCSGNVVMDTNVPDNAASVARGQYLEATFNGISGWLNGQAVTFAGGLRMEFLSALNLNVTQLAGLGLRLKFTAFSGTLAGAAFGPITETADLVFDGQGIPALTSNGARYFDLTGVTVTGTGNYGISNGRVRLAYGSSAGAGYVDVAFSNWQSSAARPALSSGAVVVGNGTAAVSVIASGSTSVVYQVHIDAQASRRSYTVTATYPVGGGAPSYVAVLAS